MSNKFNRSYVLKVETGTGQYIEIQPPFTVEFTITRNNLASANTSKFTIYNLNPTTRAKIYKDVFDLQTFRAVQFFAGYAEKPGLLLPRCFNGNIKRAWSQRQGPNFRTEIECFDGQIATNSSNVSLTFPGGTNQKAIIETLARSMEGVNGATVSNKFADIASKAVSVMGNPIDTLSQITDNGFYVDSGQAYALKDTDVVPGEIRLISAANGLIGTPKKAETMVELEMLFEPRIKPSQLIELQSKTEPRLNGYYKVTGIIHRGTISGAIGGECKTSLTLIQQKLTNVVIDTATTEYKAVTQ